MHRHIGIRWTVGDVSDRGFEALRFSITGAFRIFGPGAVYVVCVNTVPLDIVRLRLGEIPECTGFLDVTRSLSPVVALHLDERLAEGVGWKFAPLRVFPDRYELALDNDCILWAMPAAIRGWLDEGHPTRCLIAADVRPCFGQFAERCGSEPRNSGIRGVPPTFDLESALKAILEERGVRMTSELDEQGLQVAAVRTGGEPHVVEVDEVSICSPFPPHRPRLGTCGAHFVGLNVKQVRGTADGAPMLGALAAHWDGLREEVARNVGARLVA
jgi:hypothetical protein